MDPTDASISDILYPDNHLDSPLVAGKLVMLLEYAALKHNQILEDKTIIANIQWHQANGKNSFITKRQEQLHDFIVDNISDFDNLIHLPYPECNEKLFRISDNTISYKLNKILHQSSSCYKLVSDRIVEMLNNVDSTLIHNDNSIDHQGLSYMHKLISLDCTMSSSRWYTPFMFWFTIKTEMRSLLKDCQKKSKKGDPCISNLLGDRFQIVINPNLVIIIDRKRSEKYFLTFELVLMYSDVLEGRLMIDTTIRTDPKFLDLISRAHKLWDLVDGLFPIIGNSTYNIVSLLEPLTLGMLQLRDKAPRFRGAFLNFCMEEIKNEFESNGFSNESDISGFQETITKIMNTKDVHLIAEFFSFFRTFGHPILEAAKAAEKVRNHMHADKILEFEPIMKAHAIFCSIIINGYRDRHGGAWPPVEFPIHVSDKIRRLMVNGEAISIEDAVTHWRSFSGFKFGIFMPLNLDTDLSMFMKDKALSPIRKEWDSVYPYDSMPYKPPRATTSRRLIDVFLNDSKFDPFDMINYVLSGEYLRDDDFNISYSLKEKETKQVGRLFAKMTNKMRGCQVIAEYLIAKGVGRFFKENGMVKDEHELLRALHGLSVSSVPKGNKYNDDPWSGLRHPKNKDKSYKGQITSAGMTPRNTTTGHRKAGLRTTRDESLSSGVVKPGNSLNNFNSLHKQIGQTIMATKERKNYNNRQQYQIVLGTMTDEKYDTISGFVTADLRKFCLNWRHESASIFAERLNEIYGLPGFFQWMHKILERNIIYVSDPSCPPPNKKHIPLEESPKDGIFIHNPMGGIEGYCQKLWTIATIAFIHLSAYETGTRIAAVVQGDNESIAVTKRVHPSLSYSAKKRIAADQTVDYFLRLRDNLRALGHDLKMNETILSTSLFIYSKHIYFDGMVLSQSLKAISRCCFWSETLVDETRSACSNISTAVAKSIEQGLDRKTGYCINVLKTLQQLFISLGFSINETLTHDVSLPLLTNRSWMLSAALVPSSLGGFNYLNISRIYVRNIGDNVTASFADIKRMIQAKLIDESLLQKIMNQQPGDASFLDWASDPYSANLPQSQSITKVIKNISARVILSNSKNPILKGLFHANSSGEDLALATFLMDRKIIIPRAAHEILANSLTGAREEIAGMLDTTKGLIRAGLRKGGIQPRLLMRLSNYDYEQFRIFNNLMSNRKVNQLITVATCSVILAKALRAHMWRKLTRGRQIYGLEVPDPIEAVNGFLITGAEECPSCYHKNQSYTWFFIPKHSELDQINKESSSIRVPYVGSTTDERSEIRLGSVKSSSRALKSAVRIAMIYIWAYGETDDSWLEAWYLASQRVSIDLDVLKSITPISTSNNLSHRLKDRATQIKFAGSTLNRVSRFVTISNDNLTFKHDDTTVDTNLIYQQMMLLGLSTLEGLYRLKNNTGPTNKVYHLHVKENCCVHIIESLPLVPSSSLLPEYKEIKENPLIYDPDPVIEKDLNKLKMQYWRSPDLNFTVWSTQELHEGLAQSLAATVVELITRIDKDVLKEHMSISADDGVSSLLTEFLNVDPILFSKELGIQIAIKWAFEIHYRRPKGKWAMTEILRDLLDDTSKHTLSPLSNAIGHPTVFKRFWDRGIISPIYGPYLHHQNVTKIAVDMIVDSFLSLLNDILNKGKVNYIMAESDEDVVYPRYEICQAKYLCILTDLYCSDTHIPWIANLETFEKIDILKTFIMNEAIRHGMKNVWNLNDLQVLVYGTTLTYLRRGIIKQMKIRSITEVIDISDRVEQPILHDRNLDEDLIESEWKSGSSFESLDIKILLSDQVKKFISWPKGIPEKRTLESHKYRRVGINSTSCYKALDLIKFVKNKEPDTGDRLFLGEGSGSMLYTYYHLLGKRKSYYNSGVSSDLVSSQRELLVYPSEVCLAHKNLNKDSCDMLDIVPLFNGRPEVTWIGNLDSYQYIVNTIATGSLSMIHSDMESGIDKDQDQILVEHAYIISLSLILGMKDSVVISKIAYASGFEINKLLSMYHHSFNICQCFFPAYSNPESTEFYIVATGNKQDLFPTPKRILTSALETPGINNDIITDKILTIKMNLSQQLEKYLKTHYEYDSDLLVPTELTRYDKILIKIGLQVNGPVYIRKLTGYDVGTPLQSLENTIKLHIHELLNYHDRHHEPSTHLEPFPVLEKSKVKTIKEKVTRKVFFYLFVKSYMNDFNTVRFIIKCIRKQTLLVNLSSLKKTPVLPPYLWKRIKETGYRTTQTLPISTSETKSWWKALSYVPIIIESLL